MSDEEILKLSYERPSHFGELFDRHYRRFFKIARQALRSEDDAEDVVQETFVRIYKYGKKFPSNGGKFSPWSNTILKNCIADQVNKYKKSTVSLTEEMQNASPELIEDGVMAEFDRSDLGWEKKFMQFVIDKAGGATAQIINLRFVLGKSFKEIAKIMNIRSSTARVRVHRSKKIFMEAYKQFNNLL